jgi:putative ABC transport system substrate-binding protein
MKRRDFITLLCAAAWPLAAPAQQGGRLPRVVIVPGMAGSGDTAVDSGTTPETLAFRTAFEKLGWADGRNVSIDYRYRVPSERLREVAAEIVRSAPAVILTTGTPVSNAFRLATHTIPVVFVEASDPVSSGLVDSMRRPGGNVTGFTNYLFSFGGKWLEMLKEAAPATRRVLVLLAPGNRAQQGFLRVIETAGKTLGVEPVAAAVRDAAEIEHAVEAFAREPDGALLALPGQPAANSSDQIIDLAARHRLPAMYTDRLSVERGGLMSYDTDDSDLYRRAAFYVDRILKGVEPGQLPVQLPTKYDLVVNLKVAKALGLTIPLPLLASADEVLE